MSPAVAAARWLSAAAAACPVCFTDATNAGDLAKGLLWGLVILIVPTFLILGAIVRTVWRIEKRRSRRS